MLQLLSHLNQYIIKVISVSLLIFFGGIAAAQDFDLDKRVKKQNATPTVTNTRLNYANTDHLPKLDVIVPVFDPNIPKKDKDNVWPEVRRAEANRFAWMMKQALEKSQAFGAVRVTPNDSGFGEIYVHGKILRANGEDIRLEITVNDIRGKKKTWIKNKKFKYRVQESFHKSPRTQGTDSYAPIFDMIAQEIVKKLAKKKAKDLNKLPAITEMRFANMFGSEYFGKYIKEKRGSYKLVGLPDESDQVYAKIRSMRIQEQLFVDQLQPHYEDFSARMNPHYFAWQKHALPIAKERRKQKRAAILGTIAAIGGTVVAATSDNRTVQTVGVAAAVGGGLVAFKKFGDAKASASVLDEMGSTLNLDMGVQVVEFEGIQTKLEGDAIDQFVGYRGHLLKIYESEYTPDVQL
ncbi:hypothetical protein [Kordiimonas sp. SCSIO 12610]|uniref:hypothetical protein n=1 Tax=Kordiimonas sp. SCSIO 12610 TaxID=2829597 RepID=UPI00210C5634|nr:hypothetical protein [Kordiimonas sp. SCSIO 12610]UTW55660.1 hypothetical protein KFF44_01855 [Kordiimonas sp. SCSIO 12610]